MPENRPSLEELERRERAAERARKKLQHRAEKLGIRIEQLEDDRRQVQRRARNRREQETNLERAIKEAREEERLESLWTRRACVDGSTTWLGIKLVLATVEARTPWAGGVNSADRTDHADDCGDKMSQAELSYGWEHRLPGFYPANPPGTGSHEGIVDDDLAPYFGSIGSELPRFAWGLDLVDGPGFEAGAESLGFEVLRVYGNEPWHINLKRDPTPVLRKLEIV